MVWRGTAKSAERSRTKSLASSSSSPMQEMLHEATLQVQQKSFRPYGENHWWYGLTILQACPLDAHGPPWVPFSSEASNMVLMVVGVVVTAAFWSILFGVVAIDTLAGLHVLVQVGSRLRCVLVVPGPTSQTEGCVRVLDLLPKHCPCVRFYPRRAKQFLKRQEEARRRGRSRSGGHRIGTLLVHLADGPSWPFEVNPEWDLEVGPAVDPGGSQVDPGGSQVDPG